MITIETRDAPRMPAGIGRRAGAALVIAIAALAASRQQPTFRAAVDRVRVDVVVTDGSDRPITDLANDDFTIVENGRAQTITDFKFVSVPVATRTLESVEARQARPDVVTNAMSSPSSRLWAIVVDDLHLIEQDVVAIKKTLTDIVLALAPEDEVALVYIGRSDLSKNFKTDLAGLMEAIGNVRAALGFGLDAYPQAGNRPAYILAQATRTSDTLRNVAMTMAGSGHTRRAIIYVGTMASFPADEEPGIGFIAMELQRTFDQARRSNVPIYTIDPRGQVLPEEAVRGGIGKILTNSVRSRVVANLRNQRAWMSVLALNTGGRAFTNNSDLTRSTRSLARTAAFTSWPIRRRRWSPTASSTTSRSRSIGRGRASARGQAMWRPAPTRRRRR